MPAVRYTDINTQKKCPHTQKLFTKLLGALVLSVTNDIFSLLHVTAEMPGHELQCHRTCVNVIIQRHSSTNIYEIVLAARTIV